ncbi:MAG: hypothetical protein CBE26_03485 [Kiritimatiellaceae bacterium TMED266]|nr:MAG: hypothetical protein CBE26_03485 [Kiritimatiellaceae bacterium TMED266]
MQKAFAVIMAGGRGERFWPLSTSKRPKQLLDLVGDKPLIAQAVDRLEGVMPIEHVLVITNTDIVEATLAAVPQLKPENVIGEPIGRDTAPAVACAAALVKSRDEEAVFAILTADQVMGDLERFQATLRGGFTLAAENDILVTIGIQPTYPATGFGYIESGDDFAEQEGVVFKQAKRFVEKPDVERARAYLETGQFFWNAGMFIWSVVALEKAFKQHAQDVYTLLQNLYGFAKDGRIDEGMEKLYPGVEKISIDYALMEKADNIVMACGSFAWDDVGSWTALENHFEADEADNTRVGDSFVLDSSSNIVYSKDHLTALVGVRNLIVVQADGVTLVCDKEKAQDIKKLIALIRSQDADASIL